MRGEESTAGLLPLSCSLLDSRIAQQGVSTQPDMNAITSIALEYMYPCVAQFKGAVANPYSKSGNPCSSPGRQQEGRTVGMTFSVWHGVKLTRPDCMRPRTERYEQE